MKKLIYILLATTALHLLSTENISAQQAGLFQQRTKIDNLLRLSKQNIEKPDKSVEDLNKSRQWAIEAQNLSKQIKQRAGVQESLYLIGLVNLEERKVNAAKALLPNLTDTTKIKLLHKFFAYYKHNGSKETKVNRALLDTALQYIKEALQLSIILKRTSFSKTLLDDFYWISTLHKYSGNYKMGRDILLYAIEKAKLVPEYTPTVLLIDLSNNYIGLSEYTLALECLIKAEKVIKPYQVSAYLKIIYSGISQIYRLNSDYQKSLDYAMLALDVPIGNNKTGSLWIFVEVITLNYIQLGKPMEAKTFIEKMLPKLGVNSDLDYLFYHKCMAMVFNAFGQPSDAIKHYLSAIEYKIKTKENPAGIYTDLGNVYSSIGDYKNASYYLNKAQLLSYQFSKNSLAQLHYNLYKSESANGDYKSALNHLLINKNLNDSINNIKKNNQLQQLTIQYETEKKDAQLLLNEKDIINLSQQTKLMDQANRLQQNRLDKVVIESQQIKLLAKQKENEFQIQQKDNRLLKQNLLLQQNNLQKADLTKKTIIGFVIFMAIVLLLSYRQIRLKQRTNQLVLQKNELLNHLLIEKNWLLKEVHHRVKNNLQTVISLLESQAAYLKDDALKAMENCQHRIYVMSLIHQKLYQSEEVKTISMPLYISEFVGYLSASFQVGQSIRIEQEIDDFELGVAQAVPLALIINEAVTNAIKYAFRARQYGIINLSLKSVSDRVHMCIVDNGIGIPDEQLNNTSLTLGLKLMKGLCRDLNADILIENTNGTSISLDFEINNYNENQQVQQIKVAV